MDSQSHKQGSQFLSHNTSSNEESEPSNSKSDKSYIDESNYQGQINNQNVADLQSQQRQQPIKIRIRKQQKENQLRDIPMINEEQQKYTQEILNQGQIDNFSTQQQNTSLQDLFNKLRMIRTRIQNIYENNETMTDKDNLEIIILILNILLNEQFFNSNQHQQQQSLNQETIESQQKKIKLNIGTELQQEQFNSLIELNLQYQKPNTYEIQFFGEKLQCYVAKFQNALYMRMCYKQKSKVQPALKKDQLKKKQIQFLLEKHKEILINNNIQNIQGSSFFLKIINLKIECDNGKPIKLIKNFFNGLRPNGYTWVNQNQKNLEIRIAGDVSDSSTNYKSKNIKLYTGGKVFIGDSENRQIIKGSKQRVTSQIDWENTRAIWMRI